MISVTDDQIRAIKAAIDGSRDGSKRALNPSTPRDAAAIKAFLELSGKTPNTHPGLYADLTSGAASTTEQDHALQVLDIVDAGRDTHGRATARIWHLDREGEYLAGSLALVLNADTNQPLALGAANRVGGGLCPAATRSRTAQPASEKITTVGFFHSQSDANAAPKFGMVSKTSTPALAPDVVTAGLTSPVISHAGHSAIIIALGRPAPNNDADYIYIQDTNDNPPLVVPFVGWVATQSALANLDLNGNFTAGLALSTQIYSLNGSSYSAHNANQSITNQVTGVAATGVVSWNYPFNAAKSKPTETGSLVYAPLASTRDTTSAFFYGFQIPTAAPMPFQLNVCSVDWPDQPSVYCFQIPPVQFWWHCLAEGTMVTLSDGSKHLLEEVGSTHRVLTGNGQGALNVEATTRGLHHPASPNDRFSAVYLLSTVKGRTLILTGGHPVATEDGLVPACDLLPGTTIRAIDGNDQVARLEPSDFTGVFANLKLIDEVDRAKGLSGSIGTFVANEIVVGDFESLQKLHYNNTHSFDYMKARIPARYQQDYASTLTAIATDNVTFGGAY